VCVCVCPNVHGKVVKTSLSFQEGKQPCMGQLYSVGPSGLNMVMTLRSLRASLSHPQRLTHTLTHTCQWAFFTFEYMCVHTLRLTHTHTHTHTCAMGFFHIRLSTCVYSHTHSCCMRNRSRLRD